MGRSNPAPTTLSNLSRRLTWLVAILWVLIGVVFFFVPAWSQARFPWVVSDFVTMTIGGWCLGTAFLAWWAARIWTWGAVHPSLLYLWIFGLFELGVALWFEELLRTNALLTWPYLVTIVATVLAGVVGAIDVIRLRPTTVVAGQPIRPWIRAATGLFVALVAFLSIVAMTAPDVALDGRIFPEPLSFFTLRAFGAFYLALAIGAIPTVLAKNLTPVTTFMASAMGLVVIITIAAFVYINAFDFSAQPAQIVYIAVYLAVGIPTALVLRHQATVAKGTTGGSAGGP